MKNELTSDTIWSLWEAAVDKANRTGQPVTFIFARALIDEHKAIRSKADLENYESFEAWASTVNLGAAGFAQGRLIWQAAQASLSAAQSLSQSEHKPVQPTELVTRCSAITAILHIAANKEVEDIELEAEKMLINTAQPVQPAYPDPTSEMLNGDALFDAIWGAIKGWDLSRLNDGMYSSPSGNDARHIYEAIKLTQPTYPAAKAEQEPDGYQQRYAFPGEGPGAWTDCSKETAEALRSRRNYGKYEVRDLYAAPRIVSGSQSLAIEMKEVLSTLNRMLDVEPLDLALMGEVIHQCRKAIGQELPPT